MGCDFGQLPVKGVQAASAAQTLAPAEDSVHAGTVGRSWASSQHPVSSEKWRPGGCTPRSLGDLTAVCLPEGTGFKSEGERGAGHLGPILALSSLSDPPLDTSPLCASVSPFDNESDDNATCCTGLFIQQASRCT